MGAFLIAIIASRALEVGANVLERSALEDLREFADALLEEEQT